MHTITLSIPQDMPLFKDAPTKLEEFVRKMYPDGNYPGAVHTLLTYYFEFEKNALDENAKQLTFDFNTELEDEMYRLSVSSDVLTGFNDSFKENVPSDFCHKLNGGESIPYAVVLKDALTFPSIKSDDTSRGGNGMGLSLTNALLEKSQGKLFIQEQAGKVFFHLSSSNRLCTTEEAKRNLSKVEDEYRDVLRPVTYGYVQPDFKLDMPAWVPGDRKASHPRSPVTPSSSSVESLNTRRQNPFTYFQESSTNACIVPENRRS